MVTKSKSTQKGTRVVDRLDDATMLEQHRQTIIADYHRNREDRVVDTFGNGKLHRQSLAVEMLENMARVLVEGCEGFVNSEYVIDMLTGKPSKSLSRSRSTMKVNRATGKTTFVLALFQRNLEQVIFGEHTEALEKGNSEHRVPVTNDDGWTDAFSEVCKMIGNELVYCRGAAAHSRGAGKDDERLQLEKLARVSSGGRLNKQYRSFASTMHIFTDFNDDGREVGQLANYPNAFHPDFRAKMTEAFKYWKPEFFTTREVVEAGNSTPPIGMVRVASPLKVVNALGVCYWSNVPQSQIDDGVVHQVKVSKPGGKFSVVTMTKENFALHRKNKTSDHPNGTAPTTKRNGQMVQA
jgi:hypothetical protein